MNQKVILFLLCVVTSMLISEGHDSPNPKCREYGWQLYNYNNWWNPIWHWEQRWRYDKQSGKCVFSGWVYTRGTIAYNRFDSQQACRRTCECSLKPYTGRCRAYFVRYYYNPSSDTCQTFVYGGCNANGNNFDTPQDCINACGTSHTRVVTSP
ncbi:hypothetical protein LSH36_88g05045 [Paralvinella palmiformis]|uniref:BPTI/Kunitz inhibitor domain-containing protein n=1 Tax=Paralvinella palmiformis TaxID=53620 RepID=A0AAD9NDA0_9ANNE|nr:hypothetical protein LSH36_88g05045 [Paralvinella palmiformis]